DWSSDVCSSDLDDADAAHDDAERLVRHEQPDQHADRRESDGSQYQKSLIETVELRDEDQRHQEQRHAEGARQELHGLALLLVLAAETHVDAGVQVAGREPRLDLLDLVVDEHVVGHVGADLQHAPAVRALNVADALRRRARDEIADGHETGRRRDAQRVELAQVPIRLGQTDTDVDLVVGVVRPIVADQDAVRDELNRAADRRDAGAEAGRLSAVAVDSPVDAGQRPRVAHVDEAADLVEARAQPFDRGREAREIRRRQLDLDRLALRDARVLALRLDADAREVCRALAYLGEYLGGRPPLRPVDEAQLDAADEILVALVVEAQAAARVDRLELGHAEDARFHAAHERVALLDRQVAARVNVDVG